MKLNLREIIYMPGGSVSFNYEPDLSEAATGSVKLVKTPAKAVGSIKNIAGILTFSAELDVDTICVCARCLKEVDNHIHKHITAILAEGEQDGDNPDIYPLSGDCADVDDIIVTDFVLNTEQRFLCKDDCKGLCEMCGSDLNEGSCSCKADIDPRLSVLGQLLENE